MKYSGLTLPPDNVEGMFQSAEGLVEVFYRSEYRCAICGWDNNGQDFGIIPALESHLKFAHNVKIEKPLWIASYADSVIKRSLCEKDK